MKLLLALIAIPFMLTVGCSSNRRLASSSASSNTSFTRNSSENDGSSYEKAIVIEEKTEGKGIDAEYAWLKEHYPGYQRGMQSLDRKGSRSYDILQIKLSDGTEKKVYFDITNFFGKF